MPQNLSSRVSASEARNYIQDVSRELATLAEQVDLTDIAAVLRLVSNAVELDAS